MEKTNWSIISNFWEWTREDFLFTYDEEEKQQNEINKNNSQLSLRPKFVPVDCVWLKWLGLNPTDKQLYWFIDFFLCYNEKFYCTNEQLADLFEVWCSTISASISKLEKKWMIELHYKIKSWGWKLRFIHLTSKNWKSSTSKIWKSDFQNLEGIENKLIENNINICPENAKNTDISRYDVGFDPDISKERKEKVAPKEKKESITSNYSEEFEEFWKLYPAPSWRWSKKDSRKKWNSRNNEDIELIKKKVFEECVYVKSWKKEKQWVCAFEKFLENNRWVDVDIEWLVNTYMKYSWDIKKKWLDLMKEYFWEDLIKKYIFKYVKENENFNLDLH